MAALREMGSWSPLLTATMAPSITRHLLDQEGRGVIRLTFGLSVFRSFDLPFQMS